MIDLEINGNRQVVNPPSSKELHDLLRKLLAPGHLIRTLNVNGRTIDEEELDEFAVESMHSVSVGSATPQAIARESLTEAADWIARIGGVLESIAEDFRIGKQQQGQSRLSDVVEALQVLVNLLQGIRRFLEVEPIRKSDFEGRWSGAEAALLENVKGLFAELEDGDPVRLADRTGYSLPRALTQFRDVLLWAAQ
jgi:hypothetical protein